MKTLIIALLSLCPFVNANADTNIIAMSEWSHPISLRNENLHDQLIRGRLLIVRGTEPAYGGPSTNGSMTFVELQNVTGARGEGIDVHFSVTNLNCQLTNTTGQDYPKPTAGPWGGRGPFAPSRVHLPYNSTIRLYVNGANVDALRVYPSGEPWCFWSISRSDTNMYYLAGTLILSTHPNLNLSPVFKESYYRKYCTATLKFPRLRITPK